MKKTMLVLILLAASFLTTGYARAAEIAWMHVQHREYGEGRSVNRLSFGIVDDKIQYITSDSDIKDVVLFDPRGKSVKLSAVKFGAVFELYGTYDPRNSQWLYNRGWQHDSWFSVNILAELISGLYRLKVTTADGEVAERAYPFNKRVVLPVIDSESIKLLPDSDGNLVWTWQIPSELGRLSFLQKTRARASIDIYRDNINIGYFSIILPVHMGFVFIPSDLVNQINQKGNRLELKIALETRDKNNRTYSRPYILELLPTTSG